MKEWGETNMDNHIFRNALNGFNRQDVTAYIEKSQKEAAERAAQLEKEIEDLYKTLAEVKDSLDSSLEERAVLDEQLEEHKTYLEEAQQSIEDISAEKLFCESQIRECDEALRVVRSERDDLARRVSDMEGQVEAARREKESVAQLELEARKRAESIIEDANRQAEELLSQARAQAQSLIASANEQAQNTLEQACERAEGIRADMEAQVERTAKEYNNLFASFETVASHVSGELRKMDVAVSQLPINFNHLKDGLEKVLELASERPVEEN